MLKRLRNWCLVKFGGYVRIADIVTIKIEPVTMSYQPKPTTFLVEELNGYCDASAVNTSSN